MPDNTPKPKPLSPFFQRYMSAGGDNRLFASALNRYLTSKYNAPQATSPGGRGLFGDLVKGTQLVGGPGSVPGFSVALEEIMGSLFGQPASQIGNMTPPGTIDVTDPSVDPGDAELSPLEGFLRKLRVVSRAMGVGLFRGAGIAPGAGLGLAYEEGELAPPRTTEDAILHTVGAMLAGAVPFVGAGIAQAPVSGAVRSAAGSIARGAGLGGIEEAAVAGAARAPFTAGSLAKGLTTEAALGAGLGAAEATAQGAVTQALGGGENAPDILKLARDYALVGLGLGTIFRIPTAIRAVRAARAMAGHNARVPVGGLGIAPGVVHDGIRSELVNGRLRFRREEGGHWISADKLTEENLTGFREKSQQRARDMVVDTPQGQGTATAVAQSSAKKPETLPPDIATPEALMAQNTYGGMYLRRAEGLVRHLGPEKAERQLEELRKILWSDAPIAERLSVGGRVVALEQALGHPIRLPGQLPVEMEAQAIETVAGLRPYGRAEIERAAIDAKLSGRDAYSKRLWALMDSDLPETYSREINQRLAKVNTQQARGVRAGTQGIVGGRPVEVLQRPKLGLAWAKRLDEVANEPVLVDVAELKPFPKANQLVRLKDGRISRVRAVDAQKGQILIDEDLKTAPFEEDAPLPGWTSLDEVEEVASSRSSFRSLKGQKAALMDEFKSTDSIATPVPAVTTSGEPVTVVGIGEKGVKVQTKSGRTKTIPREQIEAVEAPDITSREVTTFAPGKVPQEGNRIRFFTVVPGKAKQFENAWANQEPVAKYLVDKRFALKGGQKTSVVQTHILPQPARSGEHLYAIELPAEATPKKDYYTSANEALQAIGGKRRINTYASAVDVPEEIFKTGSVSRVPEELRGAAVRPEEMLRNMTQEEQTDYLRHLLVFNENIPSEVAQPIAQAKVARRAIADAASLGDGQKLVESESQLQNAHVETAEALENVRVEESRPIINKIIDDIAAGDETAVLREAFELEGLTPKTEAYYYKHLHDLPASQAGDPARDAMIANSLNVEGQRAFISKYESPYVEYGTPGVTKPAGETQPTSLPYWTVEHVDPEGLTIRGATKKFDTPQAVAEYLSSEGYAHTLYKTHSGEYYHESNPALVAVVNPAKKGTGATMTIKELPPEARSTGFTPEQEELLIEFRELHRESASNGPQWKTVGERKFRTAAEAETFLGGKGFKRNPPTPDLTSRFKELPPMSRIQAVASGELEGANLKTQRKAVLDRLQSQVNKKILTKEQAALELYAWDRENTKTVSTPAEAKEWGAREYLGKVEEDLDGLLRAYNRQTGRVPEAVQAYAQEFSQYYYRVTGKPPFDKNLRLDTVGMPHVSDYGPEPGMGSALGGMIEDANAYDLEPHVAELPESVRQMANIRVGRTMQQMSKAADQIIDAMKSRPAPGLEQTRADIIRRLEEARDILKKSSNMQEVEGAQARMNELRRTAVAFEKLRNRIRPTSLATGEYDEIRELKRAARSNVAGARSTLKKVTAKTGGAFPQTPRKLSELDLLPANEEVMRILSQVGEGSDAIMEGPHGEQYVATLPHDYEAGGHVFYPNVLGISTLSKSDALETAQRVASAQKQQSLWAEAAMKTQRVIPEPAKFDTRTDLNLARYKATGQVLEIVDTPEHILTNDEVLVRFLDGSEMTVAKSELSLPAPGKGDWARDYRMAEYVLDGRYAQMYHREPPLGFGKLEQELGVFGTRDRSVVAGAIYDKAQELAQQVRRSGDGHKETWQQLFDLYRRSRILDEGVEVSPRLPAISTKSIQLTDPGDLGSVRTAEFVPGAEQGTSTLTGEVPTSQLHREQTIIVGRGANAEERTVKKVKLLRAVRAGTQNMGDVVLDALAQKNPKLVAPFKRAAYEKIIQQLGDDPFAELQAQAISGFLTDDQAATLRGWADEVGLPKNLSLPRLVVEMRERQALDPMAALYAVQTRKQAAILNWAEQAAGGNALFSGIPVGGLGGKGGPAHIIIKPAASIHDLRFGGILGSSWRVASKHPFTQHVMNMLYRAQEMEKRGVIKRSREFLVGMEQMGLKFDDRKVIRNVTLDAHNEGWKTWDDIVANHPEIKKLTPEQRQLYSQGYFRYRQFFQERKQDLIRHFMRRRVKPIIFDPNNAEHLDFAQALAKEYGVDMSTLREGSALLPFQPEMIYKNPRFSEFGMAPRGYNEDEISFFLRLQEQFGSAQELPPAPPPGIRPEIYDEFKETFDFWQRYGQDNYWPLVHEGSVAALDAQGKIAAWGQSIPDVVEAVRELRKQGRLSETDPVTIKQVGMVADDIIMQATPGRGEMKQLASFYAEHLDMNPDEAMVLWQRSDRPQAVMKRPGQVHGKPRKAGLKPVFEDPDKEFMLYNARIARMDYRWDVLQAWRAFQDTGLDRALSDAYGAPRMHEAMPGLKEYMEDVFTTAVGERRSAEKFADNFWMILNWMKQAPRELPAVLRGELDLRTVIDPKTYYRKYAARARASDLLGLQTIWKLGGSFGSAFANWTQFFVTTLPKLIQPGEDVGHVAKLVWQGQRDGFKLWRAWDSRTPITGELAALHEIMETAGIDLLPAKQNAGGRSIGDVLGGRPISGGSKLSMAKDWLDYAALWGFNGAEKINRFGTATVAIRRYADRLGKSLEALTSIERAEAAESARRLVRETQFLYDELSLPRALRAGPLAGPIGRILFQFKPFLINMMEYEGELIKNAFFNPVTRGSKVALGQLAAHFGAIGVLGGAVGVLHNPFVQIPYQIINWMTGGNVIDPATKLSAAQRKRRRQMQSPEENFQQSSNYMASDLLAYGLPGLIGLDMGQRVGVSGQDLTMTLDAPGLLGPHASAYWDIINAWKKYGGSKGRGRAVTGAAVGALATSLIPERFRSQIPWAASLGALAGGVLASKGGFNDFGSYLNNTPEGRRATSRIIPTALRNAKRSFELVSQGVMRDMDGKPAHVPASDRFEQAVALGLGVPTARRQEYMAMISMLTGSSAQSDNTRYILTKKAARAWAEGDYGQFYEIMLQAQEHDVDISQRAIEQELEDMAQEKMTTVWERLPRNEKLK